VKADLERIFDHVSTDVDEHCGDLTENPPRRPAFVVEATRAEQVGELLKLANDRGVPVTPKVTGLNVGGLAIPSEGGIVLDMRKMTGIEIDAAHMVAWIEPGVSWQQLKDAAEEHDLTLGFPLAPPESSVLACALMDGLSTKALAHGSFADWVHGVVAYLADGTRVVTGSAAITGRPLSRGPLPDLTGLFISWFGSTGIVTRLGFILWPNRRFRRRDAIACRTIEEGVALMRAGATTGLFDDLGGLGWPAGKWALGVDDLGPRDPDEPELYVIADYAADTKGEMRVKRDRLATLAPRKPIPVEDLIKLSPELAPFAELPTRLDFLMDHEGGGLSWVGTYGPLDRVVDGARACMEILERFNHPPLVVTRPMKAGHYAILRFIVRFDRSSPEETENVRRLNVEMARALLALDFIPYKCPSVLYDEVLPRLDPGFRELMFRIKRAVDPNGILSPERWRLC
jgi:FAD/FMN-containing dehydrogenase